MKTPITIIIFNRPEETKKVFDIIKKIKPETLLVVADGPRNEKERILCLETRAVVEKIDWKCDLKRNYSETNLGCRKRVSSGLDWVFQEVDRSIILEDDCVPSMSFFRFCDELLVRYENDEKIMHISGNLFQQNNTKFQNTDSYFFSIIPHIWGWATWRRAWKNYDVDIKNWPTLKASGVLKDHFKHHGGYEYWSGVWDQYHENLIDSWDGQWFFACAKNSGYCINPTVNLVSNIGFNDNATHTRKNSWLANLPTQTIAFPLHHPQKIMIDMRADAFTFRNNFNVDKKFIYRISRPIKKLFPKFHTMMKKILKKTR